MKREVTTSRFFLQFDNGYFSTDNVCLIGVINHYAVFPGFGEDIPEGRMIPGFINCVIACVNKIGVFSFVILQLEINNQFLGVQRFVL